MTTICTSRAAVGRPTTIFLRKIDLLFSVAHTDDGRNGGRVIFHGSSSRGRRERKQIETRCEFCSECESEPGQVSLAVEAFTFVGCMFYFPTDFR